MLFPMKKIIENVLRAIYQPFIFAVALSILVLFFYMYIEKNYYGSFKDRVWRALKDWKNKFLSATKFRRLFYLVFITTMILFKTLLNRDMWANPVIDVIGTWGLHRKTGEFTTEVFENIVLFIPFIFFLLFFLEKTTKKVSKFIPIMARAVGVSFIFSLIIEMLQLFLRLGTWQLSDLCFNTLGGIIGGMMFWIYSIIKKNVKK